MCFLIVYSVVAAVVAGDMGAIAGAAPADEKRGWAHPCDAGVLCTRLEVAVVLHVTPYVCRSLESLGARDLRGEGAGIGIRG